VDQRREEGDAHGPGAPGWRRVDQRLAAGADRDAVGRLQAVGIGRELGKHGVEDFLESKSVYVNLA